MLTLELMAAALWKGWELEDIVGEGARLETREADLGRAGEKPPLFPPIEVADGGADAD
jgi:hypothetical protein